jgi:hypothetical protein
MLALMEVFFLSVAFFTQHYSYCGFSSLLVGSCDWETKLIFIDLKTLTGNDIVSDESLY